MTEDRCVCCGRPIPEGQQVCHSCTVESEKGVIYVEEAEPREYI